MLSFFDWIKLHKYPSKGLIQTISIPERYYLYMELWHQIKPPPKYDYLNDIGFDVGDNHKVKMENLLTEWYNMQPLWSVSECYVYKFKTPPPKGINYKYIAVDSLGMRYYCYCLTRQSLFDDYSVQEVPLCLYLGFTPPLIKIDSNPLNNAFIVCKFQDNYLDRLRYDYEVSLEWNQWIRYALSELNKAI